jgi:O-antigen ligase
MNIAFLRRQPASFGWMDVSGVLVVAGALLSAMCAVGHEYSYRWALLALALLLAALLGQTFARRADSISLPDTAAFWCWLAIAAWATASLLWSTVPGDTLLTLPVLYGGLLTLAWGFRANDRQWRYFQWALMGLALIVIAYTLYQAFVLKADRPSGFLRYWNTNSALIGMILLPACASWLRRQNQGQGWRMLPLGFFIALCSFAMALGQSRGSLLALALGVAALLSAAAMIRGLRLKLLYLPVWIIAGYILGDLGHGGLLLSRLTELVAQGSGAEPVAIGSGREHLWPAGWHMAQDRPWLGWGLGVFFRLYPQYRDPMFIESGKLVHNDYLQYLVELGPIGLVLALTWFGAVTRLGWKLFVAGNTDDARLSDTALSLACILMLMQCTFEFYLYQFCMVMLLGAYLGRMHRRLLDLGAARVRIVPLGRVTSLGQLGVVGTLSLVCGAGLLSLYLGIRTLHEADHKPPEVIMSLFESAARFMPLMDEPHTGMGNVTAFVMENRQVSKPPKPEEERLIRFGIEQLDQAIALNPLRSASYRDKARLLFQLGAKPEEISACFDTALGITPDDLDTRVMYANYLDMSEHKEQALQVALDGLGRRYFTEIRYGQNLLTKIGYLLPAGTTETQKQAFLKQQETLKEIARTGRMKYSDFVLERL